jgi:hypothetical protein
VLSGTHSCWRLPSIFPGHLPSHSHASLPLAITPLRRPLPLPKVSPSPLSLHRPLTLSSSETSCRDPNTLWIPLELSFSGSTTDPRPYKHRNHWACHRVPRYAQAPCCTSHLILLCSGHSACVAPSCCQMRIFSPGAVTEPHTGQTCKCLMQLLFRGFPWCSSCGPQSSPM